MVIKTYAIHGLSEWHGDIKAGAISVRVSFTGGTASPSGAVPAYYMTKDPVTQFVIENSKEFKSGFIRIEMQQTIAGEHPRMAVVKGTTLSEKVDGDAADNAGTEAEGEGMSEDGNGEESSEGTNSDDAQTIVVGSKPDAVEWLKEHCPTKGYNGNNLRTNAAFETACKEAGVKFIITNA